MRRAVVKKSKASGFIVAIDGPSGAGKSTVSRKLAEALGGNLLDTGGMYRGVAYHAIKRNVTGETALARLARSLIFGTKAGSSDILINDENLRAKLRTEAVSEKASEISRFAQVRKILTREQRSLARTWAKRIPVVVEGRDIGTVVFPSVPFKFFVTASPQVRAKRRLDQLKKQGHTDISLEQILRQNHNRDRQDSARKIAPLRCANDAVVVDTSSMAIHQVVHFMEDHIRGRMKLVKRKSLRT